MENTIPRTRPDARLIKATVALSHIMIRARLLMHYIVSYLYTSNLLATARGGSIVAMLMGLGRFVIGAFSVVFLFYTHSFLLRRRKKEFGLYSILGMNKSNLARSAPATASLSGSIQR